MSKQKENNRPQVRKRLFSAAHKGAGALLVSIVLLLVGWYLIKAFDLERYFSVKEILTNEEALPSLEYLKGMNIFSLDLKKESEYLSQHYPDYRYVRLFRVLPDRLYVDFVRRKAVAKIKLYRSFFVDNEGVLFEPQEEPQHDSLAIITGLDTKIFGPKIGKRYSVNELRCALDIIQGIADNRAFNDYMLSKIDAPSFENLTIWLVPRGQKALFATESKKDLIEIKLSQDNLKNKIVILAGLLSQNKDESATINYVDLRFNEPVIKFKPIVGKKI
ncbi:MAG: cell division protein FtsQ/DivIB [Candidatus Omnitrophica bacterium]|nr:cell division protein FtsQ/DivIB [Candidatus Omnitrophota bacterium]